MWQRFLVRVVRGVLGELLGDGQVGQGDAAGAHLRGQPLQLGVHEGDPVVGRGVAHQPEEKTTSFKFKYIIIFSIILDLFAWFLRETQNFDIASYKLHVPP